MRVIPRDTARTEHDDFVLNVQPSMDPTDGATLLDNVWIVKPLFE
jgi:hypothetical protein